ncbi:capsule assembly Wzi family protein [Siphonobacter sp. SORGH_AS_0500]|uniref:capsule assembly Wzi family protein n=1 Tax=Siphonobacter sp. SORGH_AS_0500 TaxID=1864824 RepID=UPI000CB92296|nr:capsule assembly Wzi family protein [Siphonobacter sp. SORGH_AS_0500]MDR6193019.1 hypothetical protein [Siphonobacter sp. SORGH_AS_0500]PKK35700.1 hypothetical protein BWI96_15435 [Siphonobacter sp. SORGH_AS_0500]
MARFILFLSIFGFQAVTLFGQSVFAPLNADYYHLVDRYEIKSGKNAPGYQSTVKPYLRKYIIQLLDTLSADQYRLLSEADKFNIQYLREDSWEWSQASGTATSDKPFLKHLYEKKNDLYSIVNDDVELHVNPVFYGLVGGGQDVYKYSYINTRGIEIRGSVGNKLGFYTYFTENQMRLPGYFQERIQNFNSVPSEAAWKIFRSNNTAQFPYETSSDFFTARGYITFDPIKQINLQFGHDKVFIGNGFRSMILSDNSGPYLFLKLSTKIGPFQYINLFSELNNQQDTLLTYGTLPAKKFMAMHHLGLNIGKHLNIGLFETIIHSRDRTQGYFDLGYLNPVIFYRAIEAQKYSADNSLLGLDARYNFLKQFQIYGQLNLDEFNLQKLRQQKGWWGNKIGYQIGAKYIDAFDIENLDVQIELNGARPYTYQHVSDRTNYVNSNQSLAHPFGGNFREFVSTIRYQPLPRLNLTGIFVGAHYGLDLIGRNYGGNPLLSYNNRPADREFGNFIGQGVGTNLLYGELVASYQLRHNVFLDFRQIYRKQNSILDQFDRQTVFSSFSVRINTAQRLLTF